MTEPTMNDAYGIDDDEVLSIVDPEDGTVPRGAIEQIAERYDRTADEIVTWALRRLGDAETAIARVSRMADAEIDRARTFKATAAAGPERDRVFFDAILTDYAERVLIPAGRKTDQYPTGKLTAHKARDRAVVDDVEEFVLWARSTKNLGPFVKVEMTPKATELTKALRAPTDGEEVYDSDGRVRPEFAVLDASKSPALIGTRDGVLIAGDDRAELGVLARDAAVLGPTPAEITDGETFAVVVPGVRYEVGQAAPKAVADSAPETVTPAP